jgi:hypothetical protein
MERGRPRSEVTTRWEDNRMEERKGCRVGVSFSFGYEGWSFYLARTKAREETENVIGWKIPHGHVHQRIRGVVQRVAIIGQRQGRSKD